MIETQNVFRLSYLWNAYFFFVQVYLCHMHEHVSFLVVSSMLSIALSLLDV